MTNIAIDISPLLSFPYTGIQKYSYHLTKNLLELSQNNYTLYTVGMKKQHLLNTFSQIKIREDKLKIIQSPSLLFRQLNKLVPLNFFLNDIDIFINLTPTYKKITKGKQISVIYDLIPLIYPDFFKKEHLKFFFKNIHKTLNNVDKLIAISNSTKNDIINKFNIDKSKVSTVYPGININEFKEKKVVPEYILGKKYILYVGTIEPRKNLESILNIYPDIKEKFRDVNLVFAGSTGWRNDSFFNKLNSLPEKIKKDIIITGYISEKELIALYQNALLLLFPSLYEGFGLPVLEAMACGTPVITSNTSSMPEIAGDAAILVNPYNEDEIYNAVISLIENENLRKTLSQKGLKRAEMFSWEKSIKILDNIFLELT